MNVVPNDVFAFHYLGWLEFPKCPAAFAHIYKVPGPVRICFEHVDHSRHNSHELVQNRLILKQVLFDLFECGDVCEDPKLQVF
jgi:hypothetical protein